MRNVSVDFHRKLYNNKRKYSTTLLIALTNGTNLTITNDNIMDDGVEIEDAIGSDDNFDVIGSTIINSCNVTLYNNNEIYSDYDFKNARVTVKTILDGLIADELWLGVYTVDEAVFSDTTVQLTMLDDMEQFDRPYSESNLVYTESTTLFDVVDDACTVCNVPLATNSLQFPNRQMIVPVKPDTKSATFREVLGWVATIAGCFLRIGLNTSSHLPQLEFGWFNTDAFATEQANNTDGGIFDSASPYATGDTVNGGTFNPWNDPTSVDGGAFTENTGIHYIQTLSSQNIGVDDVVISGVRLKTKETSTTSQDDVIERLVGTDDYCIEIDENDFITADNIDDIASFLGNRLIGLTFRKISITQPNDPTIEAGDIGYVWDVKGVQHPILITRVTFNPIALQTVVCGASTPSRAGSTRASQSTKSYVKNRKQLREQQSRYDLAIQQVQEAIENANGLYMTKVESPAGSGSYVTYLHNKPHSDPDSFTFPSESNLVAQLSTAGFYMTTNGTSANPTWYGQSFDGNWLASLISVVGINAEWIKSGTLSLGGSDITKWGTQGNLKLYDNQDRLLYDFNLTQFKHTASGSTVYVHSTIGDFLVALNSPYTNYRRQPFSSYTTKKGVYGGENIAVVSNNENDSNYISMTGGIAHNSSYINFWSTSKLSEYPNETTSSYVKNLYDLGVPTHVHLCIDNSSHKIEHVMKQGRKFHYYIYETSYERASYLNFGYEIGNETWADLVIGSRNTDSQNANNVLIQINGTVAKIRNHDIAFVSSSSIRYKHNIKQLSVDRDAHKLLELPIVEFEWNDDHTLQYADMKGKVVPGIIAEDVAKIYPSAVIHDQETGEIESWDERRIIPGMLALIQEQDKKIKDQEAEIEDLKSRLEKLEHAIMSIKR